MYRLKRNALAAALLAAVAAFAAGATFGSGPRTTASAGIRWEYKVVEISRTPSGFPAGEPEKTLNELGDQGWEFVQAIREDPNSGVSWIPASFLLKRQK